MEKVMAEVEALRGDIVALTGAITDRDRSNRQKFIIAGVAVAVAVILGFVSWRASNKATEASAEAKVATAANRALIKDLEDARMETALTGCKNRNSAAKGTRDAFTLVLTIIINRDGPPDPQEVKLLEAVNAQLAQTPDRDCDESGELDAGDYLEETSPA